MLIISLEDFVNNLLFKNHENELKSIDVFIQNMIKSSISHILDVLYSWFSVNTGRDYKNRSKSCFDWKRTEARIDFSRISLSAIMPWIALFWVFNSTFSFRSHMGLLGEHLLVFFWYFAFFYVFLCSKQLFFT